jgi:hypothetical protein
MQMIPSSIQTCAQEVFFLYAPPQNPEKQKKKIYIKYITNTSIVIYISFPWLLEQRLLQINPCLPFF